MLKEAIKNYVPYNEQEKEDKEFFLNYIENNNDYLDRTSPCHFSASSWIVNKERTKVLMVFHKIYNSWSWTGGHADGNGNLLDVAIKEAKEETGLKTIKPIINDIFSLESLCVNGHIKRGKYVSSHIHLNVTYLLEGESNEELKIKEDENSDVKWFLIEEAVNASNEEWMKEYIYKKLNEKLKLSIKIK